MFLLISLRFYVTFAQVDIRHAGGLARSRGMIAASPRTLLVVKSTNQGSWAKNMFELPLRGSHWMLVLGMGPAGVG